MLKIRGGKTGAVVIDEKGDEYKFRAGEYAGLLHLVKELNINLFASQTYEAEAIREAIHWFFEHQNEIPRMAESEIGQGALTGPKPPFVVGRKYDDWAKELLSECEKAIRYIDQEIKKPGKGQRPRILRNMRSDLKHVVQWLEEGAAGLSHSMEKRNKRQREVPVDPHRLAHIAGVADIYMDDEQEQKRKIIDAVYQKAGLTPREKEIFELKYAGMTSEGEIAKLLGISKQTVRSLAKRANKKIHVVRN